MEQVKFLPLLIICVQTVEGFIWNSSTTTNFVCVGNSISFAWVYTLESSEILSLTSWTKSDGAGGLILLADDFGGFTPATEYVGRLTRIGNAGIQISNAASSDNGTYIVSVTLTSGLIHSVNASVPVYEIANKSCIPTCDSSLKCQIPQACPVKNYIDAVWTVEGVKYPSVFPCLSNNYDKPYNVCAEGAAVTSCYSGPPFCTQDMCKGNNCKFNLEQGLGTGVSSDIICVICLIFIVKLIKIVNIQDKDNLQKPILKGSDVTITASVRGFCKSRVQWIGPHGYISASKGKYSIKDNKKTRISTLKIKNLQINDSGLYTCQAKSSCGSLAKDSVKISVYEKLAVDIDIGETLRQHGSDVEIICSVYGSENKSVDWTGQEENKLTNGGRYTIASYDSNTNKSSLIIRTSSMANAEGYICQVSFKESGVSVKIYITVSDNGSLRVSIEKIILFVPASENERREWTGPQENISTNTGKYTILPYDSITNKSHLTIKHFSMIDNGSFTCQPKTSSGSALKNSITITTNGTIDPSTGAYKFVLGFGFLICVDWIACIIILLQIGCAHALKFGLGFGLGLGIPIVGYIIFIVIFVIKVWIPPPVPAENRKIKSGSRSDVSRKDVEIQMEEKGVKSDEERPPAIHIGTENKVKSETTSKKTNNRPQPSPPVTVITEDIPKHRSQPLPPKNSDVEERNLRGISANFDDSQGLPTDIPRSSRLPPIPQKQPTVQEENASENPKQKKNKKKKGKVKEGNPEEEMVELKSKRILPEDQSDED